MIEYTSLKRNFELYANEYEEATLRALRSGWYIMGPELENFEKSFAKEMGAKHCIGVNSGTDALILAVRALGIGKGDEVIVPAGAYIASIIGVTENGATPVYVDSDEYLLINPDEIEDAITSKTKAILPVHMYGQACDMKKIMEIAERHNLLVIEDCAQCHGASIDEVFTGTFGQIGCFSFYPTKPIGAFGDAGALLTDDDELAERLRLLRNYGSKKKYHNEINGVNTRLDEIQAALLCVGLKHFEEENEKRINIAQKYLHEIVNPKIKLPKIRNEKSHVFHLFAVQVDDQKEFQNYLTKNQIKSQIHYPIPPYLAECYVGQGFVENDFPIASEIAKHEVSLPLYASMPEDEVKEVIKIANMY